MKTCIKCHIEKSLSDFYKQKPTTLMGRCKECVKKSVDARSKHLYATNPEWVEKEKVRAREKFVRLGYAEKHKPTKEAKRKIIQKYIQNNPEKRAAHLKAQYIPRADGNHLHHWSYNKEHHKDVIELNEPDHAKLHRYMTYDKDSKMYKSTDGTLLDTREKHIEYFNSIKDLN